MNYQRGFQRFYAVLSVAWIAALLFALPAYRLRFWEAPIDYGRARALDTPLSPPPAGYTIDPAFPPPPAGAIPLPPGATLVNSGDVVDKIDVENRAAVAISRREKALWLAGILFLPPLLGYVALFFVIPWVYRGFKTA